MSKNAVKELFWGTMIFCSIVSILLSMAVSASKFEEVAYVCDCKEQAELIQWMDQRKETAFQTASRLDEFFRIGVLAHCRVKIIKTTMFGQVDFDLPENRIDSCETIYRF